MSGGFLTVYPGWNIWDVWQSDDLPFSVLMFGVPRDRQLRLWVEDAVRLGAPGAVTADPIDLKGGQVQILNGKPEGLATDERKEQVPGPSMVVDGPASLRTVKFFNRGDRATMAWPHDQNYLLDQTYVPSPSNPATAGPGPTTIGETIGSGVSEPVKDALSSLSPVFYIGGLVAVGLYLFKDELWKMTTNRLKSRR